MHAQTRRQREVLDLIARYIDAHGYRPSYQAIARHLGLNSRAGIARIVRDLESQGLLKRHREDGHFSIEMKRGEGVVAVHWLDVPDDIEPQEILQNEPISLPGFMLGGYEPASVRAFRVPDDAMIAENICQDDIALIELRDFSRDGQPVVAVINKQLTVLRKYYRAGAEIELRSSNDEDEMICVAANRVEILGVFRGLLRPAV